MEIKYYKEHSDILGRDMEYKVFGSSGKICFAFAPQSGRFYDFENFHMVDVAAKWIEEGKLQIVCPDSIDEESWSGRESGAEDDWRFRKQEEWFLYITDELYPTVKARNTSEAAQGRCMTTGCSMGALHAANFFFRRPDLFDTVIAMSGIYNAQYFFPGTSHPLAYDNSPAIFLKNLPADHPYRKLYANSTIIICVGQGAWEDELLESTRELDTTMKAAGIQAWFDYWGKDVSHDWNWWQKQFPYFLGKIFDHQEAPAAAPAADKAASVKTSEDTAD